MNKWRKNAALAASFSLIWGAVGGGLFVLGHGNCLDCWSGGGGRGGNIQLHVNGFLCFVASEGGSSHNPSIKALRENKSGSCHAVVQLESCILSHYPLAYITCNQGQSIRQTNLFIMSRILKFLPEWCTRNSVNVLCGITWRLWFIVLSTVYRTGMFWLYIISNTFTNEGVHMWMDF